MKINPRGGTVPLPVAERETAGKQERVGSRFAHTLQKAQDHITHERLTNLLAEITAQGRRLGEIPTYAELKAYRKLIGSFMEEVISRMYTVETKTGWDLRGRQKMFTIVREIDKVLAGLAEDIRHGQERQLAILQKVDAIRGLLIDLYT